MLPIAPSTYYAHAAICRNPDLACYRAKRDAQLRPEIQRVWEENFEVYGVRKVWRQMQREGFDVARCTVERLMKQLGIQGVIRGKTLKTTHSNPAAPCLCDHVNRQFNAPARHRSSGWEIQSVIVNTSALANVLNMAKRDIHWLKIGVEGMEESVLKSWAPSPIRPWIVVIESTLPNS